jgi:DNA cross-link repair 1A protein
LQDENISMSQFLEIELEETEDVLTNSQIQPKEGAQLRTIEDISNFEDLMKKIYAPADIQKQNINMEKSLVAVLSSEESENEENDGNKKGKKAKKIICPKYKIIENSTFAVDAFRYGEISYVDNYFLTHFHADHYIGLKKKFNHPIYLSEITAKLVKLFINVSEEFLHVVYVDTPFYLNNCKITPLDANHCPGALLFLFQFENGQNILHTGDYRANDIMLQKLHSIQLDTIYLDTTYLHTKRRMPPQNESIEYLLKHVQTYLENNIGEKFLILVGAYLIGKEKVWMSIAKQFNYKVFLETERYKAFKEICTCSVEFYQFFKTYITQDESEAQIRVVSMLQIFYPNLRDFLSENQDSYNTILGVIASGWENQKYSSGRISILHVQYSEHSSYDELENFVLKTKPKSVISTVPVRMDAATTADIPQNWLSEGTGARKKKKQKKLKLNKKL